MSSYGKTIEAGIIFLELQARLDSRIVLVVCPSGLRQKWQDELRLRFDERFTVLDREQFLEFLHNYQRYGDNERLKGIVSLESIRQEQVERALIESGVNLDLVIVDEAHHCRTAGTRSHRIAAQLSEISDAMVLLTATPIQLGDENLFQLLKILSPEEFDNYEVFQQQLAPNRYLNAASRKLAMGNARAALDELRQVERMPDSTRFVRDPYYQDVIRILSQPRPDKEQLITAQRRLLDLNTLSRIFTRARKKEVLEDLVPVRVARTVVVSFTPSERAFYDQVLAYARERYKQLRRKGWTPGWAVMMRERQVASCISAMRMRIDQELRDEYEITVEDEDLAQDVLLADEQDYRLRDLLSEATMDLRKAANVIGETDSKFDRFLRLLRGVMDEDRRNGKASKILVFSFFKGTLAYLHQRLKATNIRAELIHGSIDVASRYQIVKDFQNDSHIPVLLSSEVGAEGLDLQFCDTLFNYDLPWNRMKVEQRIGRIDRFGQLSRKIRIFNLIIESTIEQRIFIRLYERIRIFEESIGDLEAILGDEIRNISHAVFSRALTPEEEEKLAEEAAMRIERRRQELEEFDKHRLEFMGQDAIFKDEITQAMKAGRYVSESEMRALVRSYVAAAHPRTEWSDNEDGTYALDPDHSFVQSINSYVGRSLARDQTAQEFLRKLRPREIIRVTFSSQLAYERKLLDFITLKHPLARVAIEYWQGKQIVDLPTAGVVISNSDIQEGDYYFFVYQFDIHGIEARTSLLAFCVSEKTLTIHRSLSAQFLGLVQQATEAPGKVQFSLGRERKTQFDRARRRVDTAAAAERDRREVDACQLNESILNARLSALEESFKHKQQTVRGYIRAATNSRIKTMRQGQLKRIQATLEEKRQHLESFRHVVVTHRLVLAGLVSVVNG